jgi:thermostable 8-oxoguanine DNA glycosylase
MQRYLTSMAVAAALSFSLLSASSAIAMTVGTASGVQQGLAETNAVEKVVRVCRHRFFTSKRECYVDRSRPPTVCHRIRGTNRMDCY